MGALIDSSVLIHLERGSSDIEQLVANRENEEMFLSVVAASELLHGVHRAVDDDVGARRAAWVEALLVWIPVLPIDLATARLHSQLWSDLQKKGEMIGPHDAWIAATAIRHGLSVLTLNRREFDRVSGLRLEVWPERDG